MKIRSGFISNSSSSSYLIVFNYDKCSIKYKNSELSVVDLIKYLQSLSYNSFGDNTGCIITGLKNEIIDYIDKTPFCDFRGDVDKIKRSRKTNAAIIKISYQDHIIRRLLWFFHNHKKCKILDEGD